MHFLSRAGEKTVSLYSLIIKYASILGIGLLIVNVFCLIVPYNMDEFLQYSRLICYLHPASDLMAENCQKYDLNFLRTGLILPLRNLEYVGTFPILYYFPLFLVWPSPVSARFVGYVFLALEAGVLAKLFRKPYFLVLGILLLFFVFTYQHFVETGPISFQVFTVFSLCLLFRHYAQSGSLRFLLCGAVLIFLAFWVKITLLWLLPGLIIIFIQELIGQRSFLLSLSRWKKTLLQIICATGLCLLLIGSFLLSTSSHDVMTYMEVLQSRNMLSFADILHGGWFGSKVWRMYVHQISTMWNVFNMNITHYPLFLVHMYDITLYFSVPILLTLCSALGINIASKDHWRAWAYYAGFLLTSAIILSTKNAWTAHHMILSFPFLILSHFATFNSLIATSPSVLRSFLLKVFFVLLAFFACMNIYFYSILAHQKFPSPHTDISLSLVTVILADKALAERYAYIIIDWGLYYQQGIYGPSNQSVTWEYGVTNPRKRALALGAAAQKQGRKLLFLYNIEEKEGNTALYSKLFTLKRCSIFPEEASWQILAEPDPYLDSLCQNDEMPTKAISAVE